MNELFQKVYKTARFYLKKLFIELRERHFDISPKMICRPIFVIGCSRAGTTLVYKTFSESKEIGSLHKETHDFWMKLHPLRERHWDTHSIPDSMANDSDRQLISRLFYSNSGMQRIVDKNNQNGLSVPYLYALFPDAHFVYIKRNPGDNIDSLITGWNKPNEFGAWSDELDKPISIENGTIRRWCFFLADGWREYTAASIEEVCAFQYAAINQSILNAKDLIPPSQWHEVFYESLISNPVSEFKKLFTGCGLSFDHELETHCQMVLDKPYNIFSEIRVDKWKTGKNAQKIQRVLPPLAQLAIDMGYTDYNKPA